MPDETIPALPLTHAMVEGVSEIAIRGGASSSRERLGAAILAAKIRNAIASLQDSVDSRPQVLGGVPVLKGTRFSLAQLFAELAEGESVDTVADDFEVDRDSLSAILHAMAVCLNQPMADE